MAVWLSNRSSHVYDFRMGFKDHFSGHAGEYASYRPGYPAELFHFLASIAPGRDLAWDCGTGSGQAAVGLAGDFRRVLATDASPQQLGQAAPNSRVLYVTALAENAPISDSSVDLVTIAQALHWFDWERFYAEVRRVSRQGGVVAAWSYALMECDSVFDAALEEFYTRKVGPFWPPERRHTESHYEDLPFPFQRVSTPAFAMREHWDLPRILNYLRTWSATRHYRQARGSDPVSEMESMFRAAWGHIPGPKTVKWRLDLLVGKVHTGQSDMMV